MINDIVIRVADQVHCAFQPTAGKWNRTKSQVEIHLFGNFGSQVSPKDYVCLCSYPFAQHNQLQPCIPDKSRPLDDGLKFWILQTDNGLVSRPELVPRRPVCYN